MFSFSHLKKIVSGQSIDDPQILESYLYGCCEPDFWFSFEGRSTANRVLVCGARRIPTAEDPEILTLDYGLPTKSFMLRDTFRHSRVKMLCL